MFKGMQVNSFLIGDNIDAITWFIGLFLLTVVVIWLRYYFTKKNKK